MNLDKVIQSLRSTSCKIPKSTSVLYFFFLSSPKQLLYTARLWDSVICTCNKNEKQWKNCQNENFIWSFVQCQIVPSKSTSKNASENLTNQNKLFWLGVTYFWLKNSSFWHFKSSFVLKTKVFGKVALCLLWLLRFSDEFFDAIIGDH